MTPRHILSIAALIFVLLLGVVGVIDATEPGHTLSAVEAPILGTALAGLAAGALGVVMTNAYLKRRQGGDDSELGSPKLRTPGDEASSQEGGQED